VDVRKLQEERFLRGCEQFANSDLDLTALHQLIRTSYQRLDGPDVLLKCHFGQNQMRDLLEMLNERIAEGDREAAELAYMLASTECAELPSEIDKGCQQDATENDATISEWRTCTREGYNSYQTCTHNILKEHGLDPMIVQTNYLTKGQEELASLHKQVKEGALSPEEAIEILEHHSRDRLMVETMGPGRSGDLANKLFGLYVHLNAQNDPYQDEVMQQLVFWGSRNELEFHASQEESGPFDPEHPGITPSLH